jgi:hypothetical protein
MSLDAPVITTTESFIFLAMDNLPLNKGSSEKESDLSNSDSMEENLRMLPYFACLFRIR